MIKHGLDISKYQLVVDMSKLAPRVDFLYIRASYAVASGVLTQDERWGANWPNARNRGMKIGAYHFYHPNTVTNGAAQAQFFLRRLGGYYGDLPLAVDVEAPARDWTAAEIEQLRSCLDVLEAQTGRKPVIYTGNWYWDPYLRNSFDTSWAAAYPLWLAAYVDESQIGLPSPWRNTGWTLWQYTSSGDAAAYGCGGTGLDMDQFEGTIEEWNSLVGVTPVAIEMNDYDVYDPDSHTFHGTMSFPGIILPKGSPPPASALDSWSEKYYNGQAWQGSPIWTSTSSGPALEHNWQSNSPNPGVVPVDNFSVTYDMDHQFTAGTYQVKVRSDDGFEYRVDGKAVPGLSGLIIQSAGSKEYVGSFTVTAGVHHITVIHFEAQGWCEIHVSAPIPLA